MKSSIGVVLTEFYGDDEYVNRRSEIVKYDKKYKVNMFDGEELKDSIDFSDVNMYDIEDIAENWVLGVNN